MKALMLSTVVAVVSIGGTVAVTKSGHAPAWMLPASVTPQAQAQVVHTVTWFKEHRPEMATMNAACRDNPGMAQADPNCINADQAALSASFDDFQQKAGLK
jgi:hypothetical protein